MAFRIAFFVARIAAKRHPKLDKVYTSSAACQLFVSIIFKYSLEASLTRKRPIFIDFY
jgi:hypothetical protein